MRAKKEKNKFLVIKRSDLDNFFSQFTKNNFTTNEEGENIKSISWQKVLREVANNNKYIVCNQDEPYAELVWQIILLGEGCKA